MIDREEPLCGRLAEAGLRLVDDLTPRISDPSCHLADLFAAVALVVPGAPASELEVFAGARQLELCHAPADRGPSGIPAKR